MHVLCDQVTWCLGLLTISLVTHYRKQKNYGSHMIAHIHNIACVNYSTGTYFFLKHCNNNLEFIFFYFVLFLRRIFQNFWAKSVLKVAQSEVFQAIMKIPGTFLIFWMNIQQYKSLILM